MKPLHVRLFVEGLEKAKFSINGASSQQRLRAVITSVTLRMMIVLMVKVTATMTG